VIEPGDLRNPLMAGAVCALPESGGIPMMARWRPVSGPSAQVSDAYSPGVPGVIDGGGNRAAGNGNPAQCTNIACQ
jgi:hypothetical protein